MKPAIKKWMPAVAIPAVIAAVAVGANVSASAAPELDTKTPEQVIELMASSHLEAYSGQFGTSTRLGLPALPDAGAPASFGPPAPSTSGDEGKSDSGGKPGASTSAPASGPAGARDSGGSSDAQLAQLLNLVSGTHQARIYVDGADQARLQVLGDMEEQDVILNGTSLWTYDSAEKKAVHMTLPQQPSAAHEVHGAGKSGAAESGDVATRTPAELAETFLSAAEASTQVSVKEGSTVAGRAVYNLVLDPKSEKTLVDEVTIGIDAETGVPLAVTVAAVDQDAPAINVAFTSFTPKAPDAARFDFTPPANATVTEKKLPQPGDKSTNWPRHTFGTQHERPAPSDAPRGDRHWPSDGAQDVTDGEGWDTVAIIPADEVPAELKDSAMLNALATEVDGGKLLHTSLVNALITDDGRVVLGAVQLSRLQAVAQAEAR
ncbi:hypothetical protein CIK75_11395 [Glutamicibacter sp. BW78]|uniref:LolA family protein n=1 Tax=Glutamicibacter sp. BW78 TaxID=2024403 RepID=UPI000BB690F4|nr:hypothetical protein [Glutamicibacter sp. BW78]PCC24773.1 hypothetical protein CIK75_11395 [Glutamicibacter sp. BW78]